MVSRFLFLSTVYMVSWFVFISMYNYGSIVCLSVNCIQFHGLFVHVQSLIFWQAYLLTVSFGSVSETVCQRSEAARQELLPDQKDPSAFQTNGKGICCLESEGPQPCSCSRGLACLCIYTTHLTYLICTNTAFTMDSSCWCCLIHTHTYVCNDTGTSNVDAVCIHEQVMFMLFTLFFIYLRLFLFLFICVVHVPLSSLLSSSSLTVSS